MFKKHSSTPSRTPLSPGVMRVIRESPSSPKVSPKSSQAGATSPNTSGSPLRPLNGLKAGAASAGSSQGSLAGSMVVNSAHATGALRCLQFPEPAEGPLPTLSTLEALATPDNTPCIVKDFSNEDFRGFLDALTPGSTGISNRWRPEPRIGVVHVFSFKGIQFHIPFGTEVDARIFGGRALDMTDIPMRPEWAHNEDIVASIGTYAQDGTVGCSALTEVDLERCLLRIFGKAKRGTLPGKEVPVAQVAKLCGTELVVLAEAVKPFSLNCERVEPRVIAGLGDVDIQTLSCASSGGINATEINPVRVPDIFGDRLNIKAFAVGTLDCTHLSETYVSGLEPLQLFSLAIAAKPGSLDLSGCQFRPDTLLATQQTPEEWSMEPALFTTAGLPQQLIVVQHFAVWEALMNAAKPKSMDATHLPEDLVLRLVRLAQALTGKSKDDVICAWAEKLKESTLNGEKFAAIFLQGLSDDALAAIVNIAKGNTLDLHHYSAGQVASIMTKPGDLSAYLPLKAKRGTLDLSATTMIPVCWVTSRGLVTFLSAGKPQTFDAYGYDLPCLSEVTPDQIGDCLRSILPDTLDGQWVSLAQMARDWETLGQIMLVVQSGTLDFTGGASEKAPEMVAAYKARIAGFLNTCTSATYHTYVMASAKPGSLPKPEAGQLAAVIHGADEATLDFSKFDPRIVIGWKGDDLIWPIISFKAKPDTLPKDESAGTRA